MIWDPGNINKNSEHELDASFRWHDSAKMDIIISGKAATPKLRQHVAEVLRIVGEAMKVSDAHVEINLVTSAEMDKNVLSYSAPKDFVRGDAAWPLGEIYLNPSYIKKYGENFDHMLVHGFLHLLGFDHETGGDQKLMEAKELELLNLTSRT